MPDGAWDGKDLLLLITVLISSCTALYFGMHWAEERARDENIKRLQKEWAERNAERRRQKEEGEDTHHG